MFREKNINSRFILYLCIFILITRVNQTVDREEMREKDLVPRRAGDKLTHLAACGAWLRCGHTTMLISLHTQVKRNNFREILEGVLLCVCGSLHAIYYNAWQFAYYSVSARNLLTDKRNTHVENQTRWSSITCETNLGMQFCETIQSLTADYYIQAHWS